MRTFQIDIDGKPFIKHQFKDVLGKKVDKNDFRVTFNCQNSCTYCLGLLDLAIYNLRDDTAIKQGAKIDFAAGYEDDCDKIFSGYIVSVLKERDGANTGRRLLCRSGTRSKQGNAGELVGRNVNVTFGRNTSIPSMIRAIASAWGYGVDIIEDQWENVPKAILGRTLTGDAFNVLSDLAKEHNFRWALYLDRIKVIRDEVAAGTPIKLNMHTGLIGMPEMADENLAVFVDMTARLSPKYQIGRLVELSSKYASYSTGNMYFMAPANGGSLDGVYVIQDVTHVGDSWGSDWQTRIKGRRNG